MADPRADGGICHPVSLDELFPPSHGCSSHTWLLEDFPGYNFNRFRLGVILGCNKMWQTYVLLVLFFFFSLETPVALFGLKKQSSHAESRQRNLINVCELWAVFHDGLINLRKKKTKKLFSVTQADVWNQMSDSFISDLIKNWSRFSDKELDAPFVHSSNVCSSFLHPCKLDSQSALKQNKKKKKMCPHSLEVTHGTFGVSTKSAFYLLSTKRLQKVSFWRQPEFWPLIALAFEMVRFIFAVNFGPFRGGETLFLEWRFRLTLGVVSHIKANGIKVQAEQTLRTWNVHYRWYRFKDLLYFCLGSSSNTLKADYWRTISV